MGPSKNRRDDALEERRQERGRLAKAKEEADRRAAEAERRAAEQEDGE
ncbi:hypothetical protein [Actinomadura alba]|uniref:CsbD family protein n=1 Tax=Actinomadura alba TaxID=406431 RepID=A0ABR7LHL1_9ACTN|nr:hypothetical protein [Actinomadura alba]MBC6464301.1 hypothetical protein [Actinomadura alba]